MNKHPKRFACKECGTERDDLSDGGITVNNGVPTGKCVVCDDEFATFWIADGN